MDKENVRMSFVLSSELRDEIKEYANSIGLTVSSYLRNIIIKDLNQNKKAKEEKCL